MEPVGGGAAEQTGPRLCANRQRHRRTSAKTFCALSNYNAPFYRRSFAATIDNAANDDAKHATNAAVAIWQAVLWRVKPLVNYINAQTHSPPPTQPARPTNHHQRTKNHPHRNENTICAHGATHRQTPTRHQTTTRRRDWHTAIYHTCDIDDAFFSLIMFGLIGARECRYVFFPALAASSSRSKRHKHKPTANTSPNTPCQYYTQQQTPRKHIAQTNTNMGIYYNSSHIESACTE